MPNKHYRPQKDYYSKKRRNPIVRFFLILWRIIKRPFVILGRILKKKAGGPKELAKYLTLGGLAAIVFGFLFATGVVAYYSRDLPEPDKLIDRQVAQSTKIYDRTGEHLLYEISGDEKRTIVDLEALPDYVTEAVIALEDKTFYEHSGFNYQRLAKAVIYKLLGRSGGGGASTLTSQLVKNAILTNEQTISRKLKEFILVFQIERKFEKDQILQLYFNEIPYGSTAYGVEAAARLYFDKPAAELSLEEAAVLASIIQRPSYFWNNQDRLMERKETTLYLMEQQGYITEEERDAALTAEIVFAERREDITAPHFVFHVQEQLVEKYGEHMVSQGGLQVKTTLDLEKQTIAEEILAERAEGNLTYNASNAALLSMDPKTGEILAMVGSVDYFNDEIDGNVNVTTRPRQPGSSFKPIVYTYGFMQGYPPSTILWDVETDFPSTQGPYHPRNYDLKERGPISVRKALQGSLNIPAVKMLYLVGVQNVLDFATDLGYTTFQERDRFGLAVVLGGGEVTLLEHTSAFATFANEGVRHEPLAILEVKNSDGAILDEFESEGKEVVDANIARTISNVLSDNEARAYAFGLGSPLTLGGRPVAAKTGTTNDYRDAWTMGYTPNLATGVWVGNNDFSEMTRGAAGGVLAAPIWQSYMRQALAETEVEYFTAPKIETPEKAILSGAGFGFQQVTVDKASEKLATEFTPESFKENRLYVDAHNILHYVSKTNPSGPAPSNPAGADPQYQKWEDAVQAWVSTAIANAKETGEPIFEHVSIEANEDMKIVYGLPPTETDDVHLPEYKPTIRIDGPLQDTRLEQRSIVVQVGASAPRGVSRVEYYLDGIIIGTSYSAPFTLNASLKSFPNGFYTLKAIAFDDVDNSAESNVQIQLQSNESYVKARWSYPESNSEYLTTETPIMLGFDVDSPEQINQVTFFAVNNDSGEEQLLQAIINPNNGILEIPWSPSTPGTYRLYTKVSVEGSGVLTTQSIRVYLKELPIEEPSEE